MAIIVLPHMCQYGFLSLTFLRALVLLQSFPRVKPKTKNKKKKKIKKKKKKKKVSQSVSLLSLIYRVNIEMRPLFFVCIVR